MPVEITYLDEGKGILTIGKGLVTGKEIIKANEGIFSSEEHIREYRYGLTDFSNMDRIDASTSDVEEIARMSMISAETIPDYVVAIVAREDLIFGLSRMWQTHLGENAWETKIFRTMDEAKVWIKVKVKEKFGIAVKLA